MMLKTIIKTIVGISFFILVGLVGAQYRFLSKEVPTVTASKSALILINGAIGDGVLDLEAAKYGESRIINIYDKARELVNLVRAGKTEITIGINSGGGLVDAGMAFVTIMRAAKYQGVTLTCIVDGRAMSMAVVILSECNNRYAVFGSKIMWHSLSMGLFQKVNQKVISEILNFMLVKNEELWKTTRWHFFPWYFVDNFVKETHIDANEIERKGFRYLRVINKINIVK